MSDLRAFGGPLEEDGYWLGGSDLLMSPQTDKIANLAIGRGGIFGIDERYVPVPGEDLKITPMRTCQQSWKVDAYWKAHVSSRGGDRSNV